MVVQHITLKCYNNTLINSSTIYIYSTGILENVNCEIIGDNFRLLAHINGNYYYKGDLESLHIPNIKQILSNDEHIMLTSDLKITNESMIELEDMDKFNSNVIRLDKLLLHIKTNKKTIK